MLSSLKPLRQRDFALLWVAALVSNIGSWMQTVAVGIEVTARTERPVWTGLVAAAAFLPIGLMSPFGGVLADRLDRRRWLLITTFAETGFAAVLTLAAATGKASPVVLTLLVFAGGTMAAIGFPAYQAMMPDLIPSDDLVAAISLSSAQFNLGRVIGPALAGLAIVIGGYSWVFAINTASFAAVLIALFLVRLPPVSRADAWQPTSRRLTEAARATAADPACRTAVLLISVVALTASPFIALVPAMALKVFDSNAAGASELVTAQGLGAVIGALTLAPLIRRFGPRQVLMADLAAVCSLLAAYGVAPDLRIGAVAILLVGTTYIGVLTGCESIIQLHAPPALRGRMLGIYMTMLGILYPVGALAQGALADSVGVRTVTEFGAAILLAVIGVVSLPWVRALLIGAPVSRCQTYASRDEERIISLAAIHYQGSYQHGSRTEIGEHCCE